MELLPYKKAIEKCKESFNEMICTYRAELVRRVPIYTATADPMLCNSGAKFNAANNCRKVNTCPTGNNVPPATTSATSNLNNPDEISISNLKSEKD